MLLAGLATVLGSESTTALGLERPSDSDRRPVSVQIPSTLFSYPNVPGERQILTSSSGTDPIRASVAGPRGGYDGKVEKLPFLDKGASCEVGFTHVPTEVYEACSVIPGGTVDMHRGWSGPGRHSVMARSPGQSSTALHVPTLHCGYGAHQKGLVYVTLACTNSGRPWLPKLSHLFRIGLAVAKLLWSSPPTKPTHDAHILWTYLLVQAYPPVPTTCLPTYPPSTRPDRRSSDGASWLSQGICPLQILRQSCPSSGILQRTNTYEITSSPLPTPRPQPLPYQYPPCNGLTTTGDLPLLSIAAMPPAQQRLDVDHGSFATTGTPPVAIQNPLGLDLV
ncbi:hypothetical protein LZ30DRAFT_684924 [Colletotrichum cereale]|nr:hypothetical protein LZ30DRAFT_684924 [Colletotrichum cereale]